MTGKHFLEGQEIYPAYQIILNPFHLFLTYRNRDEYFTAKIFEPMYSNVFISIP